MRREVILISALAIGLAVGVVARGFAAEPPAASAFDVKVHYEKREVMIPMRDGIKLFAIVYSPRNTSRYPLLLTRTAYGVAPYGADVFRPFVGPSVAFSREGYIFVYQVG